MDVLWQFDEKDPGDPSTWYAPQRRDHAMTELNNTGMLEIYNHQALRDNRMEPGVYDAFVDINQITDWGPDRRASPRNDRTGAADPVVDTRVQVRQRGRNRAHASGAE